MLHSSSSGSGTSGAVSSRGSKGSVSELASIKEEGSAVESNKAGRGFLEGLYKHNDFLPLKKLDSTDMGLIFKDCRLNVYGHPAVKPPLIKAVLKNRTNMIQTLLELEADPNVADAEYGITALSWAGRRGCDQCVQALVAGGADVNSLDFFGSTPLSAAVEEKRHKLVRFLCEEKANVNHVTGDGVGPLWYAQSSEMMNILIHYKIDTSFRSVATGANILCDLTSRIPTHPTETEDILEMIKIVSANGCDVVVSDIKGQTPLLNAANAKRQDIVQYLLKVGCSIEVFNGLVVQ